VTICFWKMSWTLLTVPRYAIKCDDYCVDVSGGSIINMLEREQCERNRQSLNIINPECEWHVARRRVVHAEGGQYLLLLWRKRAAGFLFRTQNSFVSRTRRGCFLSPYSISLVCPLLLLRSQLALPSPPLTHSPITWSFPLGGINGCGSLQRSLQSNTVPRESRVRGQFTRSEKLEETHKHPSVACLQLTASFIAAKLQAGYF